MSVNIEYRTIKPTEASFVYDAVCLPPDLHLAAASLKTSDQSIYEIGASVGLTDTPYFCRIFKKKFGMTPTEYRKSFALFCPF